jgi:hypothetical protein
MKLAMFMIQLQIPRYYVSPTVCVTVHVMITVL